jgi:hypothetical protein
MEQLSMYGADGRPVPFRFFNQPLYYASNAFNTILDVCGGCTYANGGTTASGAFALMPEVVMNTVVTVKMVVRNLDTGVAGNEVIGGWGTASTGSPLDAEGEVYFQIKLPSVGSAYRVEFTLSGTDAASYQTPGSFTIVSVVGKANEIRSRAVWKTDFSISGNGAHGTTWGGTPGMGNGWLQTMGTSTSYVDLNDAIDTKTTSISATMSTVAGAYACFTIQIWVYITSAVSGGLLFGCDTTPNFNMDALRIGCSGTTLPFFVEMFRKNNVRAYTDNAVAFTKNKWIQVTWVHDAFNKPGTDTVKQTSKRRRDALACLYVLCVLRSADCASVVIPCLFAVSAVLHDGWRRWYDHDGRSFGGD